ncbi:phage head morphogenesis protein [Candidatus Galacturonibacter soehngenii]|uniref:Phage head morphogenesis protein n=2 Tax=Candidatus Galacturonatibacter soehngenii TaxID=2307010 RepID=A0A7V7UC92_9FIRM|nr:phage head morphogenesis protein [Candidatus Galacturonibacter soehngenii]
MFEYMESAEETASKIAQIYYKASNYISYEIDSIFDRFVSKHKLTEKEAIKLLNSLDDRTSIEEAIKKLKAGATTVEQKELIKLLESYAYRARIDRLQELQSEISLLMKNIYQQEKNFNISHYVNLAQESFYKSMFDIQQMTGYGFNFSALSPTKIDKLLNSKWIGENYSNRIWNNTQALAQDIKEELLIDLLTGRSNKESAKIIQNKFAQGSSVARRLVRTESNFIANEMEMLSYEENGIETYIFVATLDLKTSKECQGLDGKRFEVKDRKPNVNCPPMHPWCRSTTICNITDEELANMKRRARNPITGKNELVPANMTYEQWYKKYVADNPDAQLMEKKVKNLTADKKQFKRYKKELGRLAPKDIEEFQNLKYTNENEYGILKAQVKGMSYYNKVLENEPEITKTVTDVAQTVGMDTLGLEYRVKTKDSYLRKIRSNYKPGDNEYEINDILRYTFGADTTKLADRTLKSIDKYSSMGYNTIKVKNSWLNEDNPYKGINTIIQSPNGQKFELQYHTQESFDLKNGKLHELYEKQRLIADEESEEFISLRNQMFELSDKLTMPDNIGRVK